MYTKECYSVIKKNKIMSFAATWMDLQIVILSEVTQTGKEKYWVTSLYVKSKKNDELTKHLKYEFMIANGKDGGRDSQGVWDGHTHCCI